MAEDNPLLGLVGYHESDSDEGEDVQPMDGLVGYGAEDEEAAKAPALPSPDVIVHAPRAEVIVSPPRRPMSARRSPTVSSRGSPRSPGRSVDADLQVKVKAYFQMKAKGRNVVGDLKKSKSFRNPTIYSKLVQFCKIDEIGSNYPPELFNPRGHGPKAYYDVLDKEQRHFQDKNTRERERRRKERKVIEFQSSKPVVQHISSGTTRSSRGSREARKNPSKWEKASNGSRPRSNGDFMKNSRSGTVAG